MKLNSADKNTALIQAQEMLTWRPLKLLNYYRLLLCSTFLLLFVSGHTGNLLGSYSPSLFFWTCTLYTIISISFLYAGYNQQPGFKTQVIIEGSIDIIAVSVLMHSSGGIESGLGMLLIIHVTACSIFLSKRHAYLFASLASIALLAEQATALYFSLSEIVNYPKAGLLGVMLFGSAILASSLATRSRESEALASQQQADLAGLEKLNEHIIKNMRTGIVVVLPNGQIYMANSAAESLLGNQKLDSRPHLSRISTPLYKRLREWQVNPDLKQTAIRQERGLPNLQAGMSKLDPARDDSEILIFLEDAAQLNLRFQEEKLASLGRLTASIAHEIRNPLGAINHAAQLLTESLHDPANVKLSSIITTQVNRLNHTIENILQLSRQNQATHEEITLNKWLTSFKEEFCHSQGLKLNQMEISISPANTVISFDSNHLHQVIWNLCSNAITHGNKDKSAVFIQLHGGKSQDARQPILDIIDNGPGIDEEVAQQIFDPFFTTSTQGTGLGLYITKEMIENNRAKISYIPLPTGGSCFRIQFAAMKNDSAI